MTVTAREVVRAVEEVLEAAIACCADDDGLERCFFCAGLLGDEPAPGATARCEGPLECLGADLRTAVKALQALGGAKVGQAPEENETKEGAGQ